MKKYKLIKWYPSLREYLKGRDVTAVEDENNMVYNLKVGSNVIQPVFRYEVENNPEFWEEVVEKDFEILSFISNQPIGDIEKNTVLLKNGQDFECWRKPRLLDISSTEKELLKNNKWNIHSVKRLSDGEVFTVGDKFINHLDTEETIFKIDFSKHRHTNGKLKLVSFDGNTFLGSAKKVKKPLFTTEDGVDIFENDQYFWISSKDNKEICSNFAFGNSKDGKRNVLYFSTEKAAKEYILMNKPCLSINDVKQELVNGCDRYPSKTNGSRTLKLLIELVKSK